MRSQAMGGRQLERDGQRHSGEVPDRRSESGTSVVSFK